MTILLALAFACADPPVDDSAAPPFAPDAPGPWAGGTEAFTAPGPDGIELTVQLWFPASEVDDRPYRYDDLVDAGVGDDGVPDCAEPRPVVLFSHGNGGVRYQSWFFTEHLATHGYLVAAPDHVGNTFFDASASHDELILRRPADIAATFDALVARSADPADPLYGCVDPAAGYAMAGHSFGGYTTLAVAGAVADAAASAAYCATDGGWLCENLAAWAAEHPDERAPALADDRAWAALPMSPAGYEVLVGGLGDLGLPTMILSGHLDDLTPWETGVRPIYEGLSTTPRYLVGVIETGHYAFSDACELLPTYPDCSEPGYVDPAVVHAHVNRLATAFLAHVQGDPRAAAWLVGDGEVELTFEAVDQ
ncbi:MAG: hypothetical protein H6739_24420 [Alphaproteobacteria bacterium]|nr:hypothetical protein [Alphaproteobacteria bacterium]